MVKSFEYLSGFDWRAEDITALLNDEKRKCLTHNDSCDLPSFLDCFGCGFSCTSYSLLNKDSKENASAMDRQTKGQDDSEATVLTFADQ